MTEERTVTGPVEDRPLLRTLPSELRVFLWLAIALFAAIMIRPLGVLLTAHSLQGFKDLIPVPMGEDLNGFADRIRDLHTAAFFKIGLHTYSYPAPCIWFYLVFLPFDKLNHGAHSYLAGEIACDLCFVVCFVVALVLLVHALVARGLAPGNARLLVFGTALVAWPVIFAMQRCNFELFLWLAMAAAIWAYSRDRWYTAAIIIGLVASCKIYPGLAFALFLRPKKFGALAAGLAVAAVSTIGSLKFIGPTIAEARAGMAAGLSDFVNVHSLVYDPFTIGGDHSLFSLIKRSGLAAPETFSAWLHGYLMVMGLVMLIVFFGRVMHMPRPNQVMLLVLSMICLPPTSYDYTLQSAYIPAAWLALIAVSAATQRRIIPGLGAALVLLAMIVAPENFLTLGGVRFDGQFKAVLFLALLAITSIFPFADPAAGAVEAVS